MPMRQPCCHISGLHPLHPCLGALTTGSVLKTKLQGEKVQGERGRREPDAGRRARDVLIEGAPWPGGRGNGSSSSVKGPSVQAQARKSNS